MIYTVRFLNPTTVLAGGSGDGPLMAVNVQSKEVVDTLTFGKRGINTISVCAENIVVGGSKGAGKFIPIKRNREREREFQVFSKQSRSKSLLFGWFPKP